MEQEHASHNEGTQPQAPRHPDSAKAMAAVAADAKAYAALPEPLRDDEDVTFAAACGSQWVNSRFPFRALKHASARLRRDRAFLDRLLRSKPEEYEALDEA